MTAARQGPRLVRRHVAYYNFYFGFILLGLLAAGAVIFWPWRNDRRPPKFVLQTLETAAEFRLPTGSPTADRSASECNYYTCFDVYRCGRMDNLASVYVYPIRRYLDEHGVPVFPSFSWEFMEMLDAVMKSRFFTSDPSKACIFVPSVDLLNQNVVRLKETSQVLASLPYWNKGVNHLLFNMLPGSVMDYSTVLEVDAGKAMVAGGGFNTWTYRRTFDISIPLFSPLSYDTANIPADEDITRRWLVVSSQVNIHWEFRQELQSLSEEHPELLVLERCGNGGNAARNSSIRCRQHETYSYPRILQDSTFCLVIRGARLGQAVLSDAMMLGCIPVVLSDGYVMPFSEVLDWKRAAMIIREDEIQELIHILKSISDEKIAEMRRQARFLWEQYFGTTGKIALTTLQIINDRVFPHAAWTYEQWNDLPGRTAATNPLFLPVISSKSQGFTAVILTYDRLESLFMVIQRVVQAPSLAKVLVVWNNQRKPPPPASAWPKIGKPLKVVQTQENKLSNRFYPYDEIETEAILAIDDDIIMLTADELEFGYEVWREFPDRIVGFPSRVHLWDNATGKWKYESEWTNEISMVLTGAAFYHKYFSYLYTTSMPGDIKAWVDEHMNCEDIAMNFLVANVTGKAPVKVTPRKKFKCPECTNVEVLSADLLHMAERTECINRFAQIYGGMPLKTVEFRADPVLYKDNFPEKLKRFNNVGAM